jgi:hypothetical protein
MSINKSFIDMNVSAHVPNAHITYTSPPPLRRNVNSINGVQFNPIPNRSFSF